MKTYDDYKEDKSKDEISTKEIEKIDWTKFKIVVPTDKDKEELMEAFKHFHDSDIDTNYITVNQLSHEYLYGTNIIVDKEEFDRLNKKGEV